MFWGFCGLRQWQGQYRQNLEIGGRDLKMFNILYMCDDSFAPIAGISITSLFESHITAGVEITVFLLEVNLSKKNKEKFLELAEKYHQKIVLIDAAKALEEIEKLDIASYRGSAMTNLRLCFERFIPKYVEKLVYLDCDTLICRPIAELMDFEMHGKLLGMVLDAYGAVLDQEAKRETVYYNAGVLLIDCKKWREEQWTEKIMSYIRNCGAQFSHPDQDIFNIVCEDEIVRLPLEYNFQVVHRVYPDQLVFRWLSPKQYYSASEIEAARINPGILHMVRIFGCNPWHKNNSHPDKEIFEKYKNVSLWRDMEMWMQPKDSLISVEKFLYRILPEKIIFPISLMGIKAIQRLDKKNNY